MCDFARIVSALHVGRRAKLTAPNDKCKVPLFVLDITMKRK